MQGVIFIESGLIWELVVNWVGTIHRHDSLSIFDDSLQEIFYHNTLLLESSENGFKICRTSNFFNFKICIKISTEIKKYGIGLPLQGYSTRHSAKW